MERAQRFRFIVAPCLWAFGSGLICFLKWSREPLPIQMSFARDQLQLIEFNLSNEQKWQVIKHIFINENMTCSIYAVAGTYCAMHGIVR